jgi:hypothetical protein
MKNVSSFLTFAILCFICLNLFAQENYRSLLLIHEDKVIPSMEDQYWQTSEKLKKTLEENKVEGLNYWAFRLDDGTYMYVQPLENHAVLDVNLWKEVEDKIGEEAFGELMSGFNGTYLSHRDYIIQFDSSKSYMMEDLSVDDVYREWHFQYIYQEKMDDYMNILDEWKKAFTDVNSPMGYGVYFAGLGMDGPVCVIQFGGENKIDLHEKNNKTTELMNGKRSELWQKTKKFIHKLEIKRGSLMEDLTYMPTN